jgi:hypothetical protein
MKSTGKDSNTVTIIHDCEERSLNSDFGPREEHNHPQYLGVPRTKSQYSFEETSKNESHSLTSSNESPGNVSKIGPFPADINMCPNELSTAPQTNRDLSRQFHNDEEHIGKKATSAQMCSRKMEIVNNAEPNYSTCKYLQKGNSLVKSIEEDYDRSCIYSLSQKDNLPTGNSSLQTGNPSLQIGNSSLQTSNLNLHPGKWNLQTGILSSIDDNSRLQAGNNWKLSGPCKHGLCSSKKPSSDDGLSCRICHSVTDLETLVSPCLCTGSMKYVHESCLLNWLKSCVKTKCELCLHEVPVKKLVKPLREVSFVDVVLFARVDVIAAVIIIVQCCCTV